ncbi:MAG: sigma factor, partial [Pseudomonadota bacterium]
MSQISTNKSGQIDIARLYQEHSSALVAYLRRQFGDGPPCPEDMAQQAFEKLLQRQQTEQISNYPGFLRQTARNLTISALRHAKVRSL